MEITKQQLKILAGQYEDELMRERQDWADRRRNTDKARRNRLARHTVHNTLRSLKGPVGAILASVALAAAGVGVASYVRGHDKDGTSPRNYYSSELEEGRAKNDTVKNDLSFGGINPLATTKD